MNVENVEPRVIQQFLDDFETLRRKSKEHGGMTNGKWDYTKIKMACAAFIDDAGKFDASRWSQLSLEKQEELLKRLTTVRDELLSLSETADRRQSNYYMQGEGGSKQPMIWLAIFGFIFVATLLSLIR